MAIYIDYDKCYDGNLNNIGKSNLINNVSININAFTENQEQNKRTIAIDDRKVIASNFKATYYDTNRAPAFVIFNGYPKQRSYFYTRFIITLPFSRYDGLKDAKSISITPDDIKMSGIRYLSNDDEYRTSYDKSSPLYTPAEYTEWDETTIVKSNPSVGQMSYDDVVKEYTEKYEFLEPNTDGESISSVNLISFEKKSSYAVITIDILTKLIIDDANLDWSIASGIRGRYKICYEFDNVTLNVNYDYSPIETQTNTVEYGDTQKTGEYNPSSQLFSRDATLFGNDFAKYYANETIANYGNGKYIISLKVPTTDYLAISQEGVDPNQLLKINDECYVYSNSKSKYYDSDGNEQLFKVIKDGISFEGGIAYQNVELESIDSFPVLVAFNFENNVIKSLTEPASSTTKILKIPYKIGENLITEIGEGFIENNDIVEKIELPFSITKIDERAFAYTTGIRTNIKLPDGLVSIGRNAFISSTISGDLIIPEGVTEIGDYSFASTKLDGTVSIPSTFKFDSGAGAFVSCFDIERVIIYSTEASNPNLANMFDENDASGNPLTYPIYALDEMIDIFKAGSPESFTTTNRIKSINELL